MVTTGSVHPAPARLGCAAAAPRPSRSAGNTFGAAFAHPQGKRSSVSSVSLERLALGRVCGDGCSLPDSFDELNLPPPSMAEIVCLARNILLMIKKWVNMDPLGRIIERKVTCEMPGVRAATLGEAGTQGLIYLQSELCSLALPQQRTVSLACDVVTCPDISKKIIKTRITAACKRYAPDMQSVCSSEMLPRGLPSPLRAQRRGDPCTPHGQRGGFTPGMNN